MRRYSSRPVLDARHSGDGERFVETQKDVRQPSRPHTNRETGPALYRLPFRIDTGVDAVVQHVVIPQRIVAVEAATSGELGDRGIQRDRAPILPPEQGDVFSLLRRTRESERVESAGIDFGEEVVCRWEKVPRLRAEILEIDVEGFVRLAREDIQRPPCQPILRRAGGQTRRRHALLVIGRTQSDVGLFEREVNVSLPEKSFTCPRSAVDVGENRISPRPISTSPVTPSSHSTR